MSLRPRRLVRLAAVAVLGLNTGAQAAVPGKSPGRPDDADLPLLPDLLRPERVCMLTNIIAVGVNSGGGPSLIFENVSRAGEGAKAVWRGVHFPVDVAKAAAARGGRVGFDVLDADASDLRLRSSEARWETLNAFRVEGDEIVRLVDTDGDGAPEAAERFGLQGAHPLPEGPGAPILVQAVPWSRTLRARAVFVDRWRGEGEARLREAVVEVTGEAQAKAAGRMLNVWKVRITAAGAYTIDYLVTKDRPHRIVRTAYISAPGAEPFISELAGYANGQDCAAK